MTLTEKTAYLKGLMDGMNLNKEENTGKLLAAGKCSVPTEQVKALVLTIKYDGTQAILTTGSAFNTFVMSKEPDEIWDRAMMQFLARKEIPFEKL